MYLSICQCFACLWGDYLFLIGVPLFLEPAAFSVKTIPRTRNPKVKKPHFPPMSLTLQVTFHFHFQAYSHILMRLMTHETLFLKEMLSSYSLCISVCITLSDCLICFCLSFLIFSHLFLALSLTHTQTHKTSVLMMVWTRHAEMVKGGVCNLLSALCCVSIFTWSDLR